MYNGFTFDNFFDLPWQALPQNCEYYFNILFVEVALPPGELEKVTGVEGLWEITDISQLTDARPMCVYYYEDEEAQTWDIDATPHTVVEVNTKTGEVSWYDMLDFDTDSPWSIEPIEEDFDYDDDDDSTDW